MSSAPLTPQFWGKLENELPSPRVGRGAGGDGEKCHSFGRLPADWLEDEPCPIPADLAIEIISQGQTFGEMIAKATGYLVAGVSRVWIVDSQAKTITVFFPDRIPATFQGDDLIQDPLLSDLELKAETVFQEAGLS